MRRVKVAPRRIAGLYQQSGLAPQSALLLLCPSWTTPANQNERPVVTILTTLQFAEGATLTLLTLDACTHPCLSVQKENRNAVLSDIVKHQVDKHHSI